MTGFAIAAGFVIAAGFAIALAVVVAGLGPNPGASFAMAQAACVGARRRLCSRGARVVQGAAGAVALCSDATDRRVGFSPSGRTLVLAESAGLVVFAR